MRSDLLTLRPLHITETLCVIRVKTKKMTIEKNMFNFLQFRDEILNIDNIEADYNIKLPPIYRAFITTFKPYFNSFKIDDGIDGDKFEFISPKYFSGSSKQEFSIDDNSICPMEFKEPHKLLNVSKNQMWAGWEGDIIFIAEHSYYGGLMLGIKENNADKIYHNDGGSTTFIANNIFEFLKGIYYVKDTDEFPELKLSDLYRNWDEKLWRLRVD